jgi:hypothetical protein
LTPETITLLRAAGRVEHLPFALLSGWGQWVAETDGLAAIETRSDGCGWVDPRHLTEVWLPEDLPPPTTGLGVTVALHDGVPKYLAPSIDFHVTAAARRWRNWGLASLPVAQTWLAMDGLQLGLLTLSAFRHAPGASWSTVAAATPAAKAVAGLVRLLAEGPEPLRQGFHLVHLPLVRNVPAPAPDEDWLLMLNAVEDAHSLIDRSEIPGGLLRLTAKAVARMSDSDYQPAVYSPLVEGLRNDD